MFNEADGNMTNYYIHDLVLGFLRDLVRGDIEVSSSNIKEVVLHEIDERGNANLEGVHLVHPDCLVE